RCAPGRTDPRRAFGPPWARDSHRLADRGVAPDHPARSAATAGSTLTDPFQSGPTSLVAVTSSSHFGRLARISAAVFPRGRPAPMRATGREGGFPLAGVGSRSFRTLFLWGGPGPTVPCSTYVALTVSRSLPTLPYVHSHLGFDTPLLSAGTRVPY